MHYEFGVRRFPLPTELFDDKVSLPFQKHRATAGGVGVIGAYFGLKTSHSLLVGVRKPAYPLR